MGRQETARSLADRDKDPPARLRDDADVGRWREVGAERGIDSGGHAAKVPRTVCAKHAPSEAATNVQKVHVEAEGLAGLENCRGRGDGLQWRDAACSSHCSVTTALAKLHKLSIPATIGLQPSSTASDQWLNVYEATMGSASTVGAPCCRAQVLDTQTCCTQYKILLSCSKNLLRSIPR